MAASAVKLAAGNFSMEGRKADLLVADGEALPFSRVQLALERAGFHVEHVESFREDYARTLRAWTERLDEHLDEAEKLAGVERTRIWRLYLRAARHGFDTSITAVYQVRARRGA